MTAPRGRRPADVDRLMELSRALVAVAVRSMAAVDGAVSLPQFRTLAVLEHLGTCTAGALAEQVGLHASTMTRLCDRLVAQELITRAVNPHNRRQVDLTITATGTALVLAVWQAREDALARALRAMTTEQRRGLRDVAPVLTALLGADSPGGSFW